MRMGDEWDTDNGMTVCEEAAQHGKGSLESLKFLYGMEEP